MLRSILSAFAIVIIVGSASVLHAGAKCDTPVTIDNGNHLARGALGTARNSTDSTQNIMCYVSHITSSGYSIFCSATDSAGNTASCSSTDANKAAVVGAMTDHSYVAFTWDANHVCTQILVENGSCWPPMGP